MENAAIGAVIVRAVNFTIVAEPLLIRSKVYYPDILAEAFVKKRSSKQRSVRCTSKVLRRRSSRLNSG